MKRIDENLWLAVEPPLGFADAVVERMLTKDDAKRASRPKGYRLTGLLLAAVLVSGAAFGLGARAKKTEALGVTVAVPYANKPATPLQQRVARIAAPKISPIVVSTMPRASSRPVEPAVPAIPASTASSAPPRVPPCQCQRGFADMICDCY